MSPFQKLFTSSLGRKYLMAITGLMLFGFVVAHLLGNLQVFLGPEAINAYGYFLQSKPELVWGARLVLLATVLIHVWSAITLSNENKAARPVQYAQWNPTAASYASRTMLMSGLIIGAFIIYHLLHFTVKAPVNMTGKDFHDLHYVLDGKQVHDVHGMIVAGFQKPIVALFYLIAMGLLCLHLSHGISAMFQSLGLKTKTYGPTIDKFAKVAAGVIFAGYASIPLSVLLHIVK